MNRLFRRHGETDIGWTRVVIDQILNLKRAPFPIYHDPRESRFMMAHQTRVALFSDWATGEPETRAVAEQIESANPQQIIYLGNVYRSGLRSEAREHLLRPFPRPKSLQRRWALNGNHDMLAGGWGYFEEVLPAFGQPASYFSISNGYWRLIGLDTAYRDRELSSSQFEWLEAETRDRQGNILLTHHPPYSAYEAVGGKILMNLKPLLEEGRIHAWFWGWEHRHVIYKRHFNTLGRCIGHGGLPYRLKPRERQPDIVAFENCRSFDGWHGIHGFAVLDLNGTECRVKYIDEDGATAFAEEFPHPDQLAVP
jgi:hypothetical protein